MRRVVLFTVGLLLAAGAAGAEPRRLAYEIRKDGQPIGREDVVIQDLAGDMVVEVETHSRTTVLFMDFAFDHKRREDWRGGRLESLVADTNDDGTVSHLEVTRGPGNWRVVHNGAVAERGGDSFPATLWTAKVVEAGALFGTIDAAPYQVRITRVGEEAIDVLGVATAARHFRLEGDLERDLWYGADGTLLKTAFKRKGFPIEFVRVAR